jgi:hypothetical protein
MQALNSELQFCDTQSWQESWQTPPLQEPLQHSVASTHMLPSGRQSWQTLLMQEPLQQLESTMQASPSGEHDPWQMPKALHWPLQHCVPLEHMPPSGVHGPQGIPQIVPTCCTQRPSQKLWQQNGSLWQILITQSPQDAFSAAPVTQGSCGQTDAPQRPLLHIPEQQS